MPEIDDELVARAIRWCAEAGRQATPDEVRAALGPLTWDQLLAARALLADPPPARPLGPAALGDLARGTLPEMAAEREREGRYRREPEGSGGSVAGPAPVTTAAAASPPASPPAAPAPPARPPGRRRTRAPAGPLIRRARDRVEAAPAPSRALPLLDELCASEGRAVLGRLVRERGARRTALVAALGAGWRRADGAAPDGADLARLLDAHGLTRWFERRERDEILHALRAGGGRRAAAARVLQLQLPELDEALDRLGARRQAEAIRDAHRDELRHRATLSERVRLLLTEADRLADLELLEEVERDLRQRLPEHVRALRASGAGPLATALAHSLGTTARELASLAARLGLDLDALGATAAPPVRAPASPPPSRFARPAPAPRRGAGAPGRVGTGAPPRRPATRYGGPSAPSRRQAGPGASSQRPGSPGPTPRGGRPRTGAPATGGRAAHPRGARTPSPAPARGRPAPPRRPKPR